MNLDKLDAAIAYIEKHPDEHNQGTWLDARCGTTACLAGHVSLLNGGTPIEGTNGWVRTPEGREMHVEDYGRRVLDLDDEETNELFYADSLSEIKRYRDLVAKEYGEAGERSDTQKSVDLPEVTG